MCHSKTCCQTLKYFNNVFVTGGYNMVEVFESLTTNIWMMDTVTNAISKNLPSSSTKWLSVFLHCDIYSPPVSRWCKNFYKVAFVLLPHNETLYMYSAAPWIGGALLMGMGVVRLYYWKPDSVDHYIIISGLQVWRVQCSLLA